MELKGKKIAILTHYLVYGAPQALREFLIQEKAGTVLYISHPLYADGRSFRERIGKGQTEFKKESGLRTGIGIVNYFLEAILSLKWVLREKGKFDLCVAADPLNAAVGVIVKRLGKAKKLVFYTIDYVPQRFSNRLLNAIYHRIDRFCVRNADEVWNVSPRIAEGREKVGGMSGKESANQKVVPIGVWFDRVKRLPFEKIKRHQLLFVGNLLEKQGVQLVLDAMPGILKEIPDFHFLIVGGGEYEDKLKGKVKESGIGSSVTFTGWIKEREKLDGIMADSALAIAMYDREKDTFTYYADPTKLKDYLSAGLPIILTDVPHNAHEIEDSGCGIIVHYDKDRIAEAVIRMMRNEEDLRKYRERAIEYAKKFEWGSIFNKNLEKF